MKIALITDTHFGVRNDHAAFDHHMEEFFTKQFFPYLKKHKITTVIHLGDIFDRRKQVNLNTLHNCRRYFFDPMYRQKIKFVSIVGNHDTFFKNTNLVNSPSLLLNDYANVEILYYPQERKFGDLNILLVPWICEDNAEESFMAMDETEATVCFGHFEIQGFAMYRGMVNTDGLPTKDFDKFDLVCSGHFHHRSSSDKIFYLGSPYQMTWSDAEDARGFHVFDTETLLMEFVENEKRMFHKLEYDDSSKVYIYDTSLKGCYVKLIVINKTDFAKFDEYVRVYQEDIGVADLKIVEDFSEFESAGLEEENVEVEDTLSMLAGHVDSIDTDADKDRIKHILHTLYVEAQHLTA